jgi:hypothetical protein
VPLPVLAALSYTGARWLALGATLVLLLAALLIARGGSGGAGQMAAATGPPLRRSLFAVLQGKDRRLSTSKTVAFAWTVVVIYIFFALIFIWPDSWSDALKNLSPTYLLLLGGPFASLVLAKAAVTTRIGKGSLDKPVSTEPPRLSDLFNDDDGMPDLFDVQYVVFNVVAIVFVIVAFGRAGLKVGFPEIPDGLLLLTAGPASVYVANKFMPSTGPTIFTIAPQRSAWGEVSLSSARA